SCVALVPLDAGSGRPGGEDTHRECLLPTDFCAGVGARQSRPRRRTTTDVETDRPPPPPHVRGVIEQGAPGTRAAHPGTTREEPRPLALPSALDANQYLMSMRPFVN